MSGGANPAVSAPSHHWTSAMHDRLRMNEHVESLGVEAEQMMCLDEFEALVHQCGGIDVDL